MTKEKKERVLFHTMFWIMFCILAAYFIGGELFLPSEWGGSQYDFTVFDVQWKRVMDDGTLQDFKIPGKSIERKGEVITLETKLPDKINPNSSIMFWNEYNNTKIYIDGELRQEYDLKDSRLIGSSSPAAYVIFELFEQDQGKTLTLVCSNNYAGAYSFKEMYYGDKMGMWMSVIRQNLGAVVVAGLAILLAMLSIVFSLILERHYQDEISMKYLGFGVLLTGIWVLANSSMRQIIFSNISVISDVAFIAPGIIPLPFLMYVNVSQKRKYSVWYRLCGIFIFFDFLISNTLVILNIQTYTSIFPFIALSLVLAVALMLITMILDLILGQIHTYRTAAICMLIICISGLVQVICYMLKLNISYSGSLIAIALLLIMGTALHGTMSDMLRLGREKDEAVYASKSKAQFLANMSHEIRTPINAVLGMNEMILREETQPHILEYAKDIQSAGRSLLSLINDILDFSKIESGKMEILLGEYEVSSLLNDSYNLVALRAKNKNLQIVVKHNENIPRRLLGDEVRIRQIIVNLLTNGIKYTDSGTVSLFVDYEEINEKQLQLKIMVQDTGMGITEEDQKKLFQSFQRVEEKRNRNIEGTGLGLAITKQLLELMNGTITVESEYGKGSVFRIEIPQDIVQYEPMGELSIQGETQSMSAPMVHRMSFKAPKARILIVDDVLMNLKVMSGLLKETKIQIDFAESGMECLKKVCQEHYDIIFLDHMMPAMDGLETLRQMKQMKGNLNWQTPVIMLTANAIMGAREEYLEAGFADYLSKPVESAKLDSMLCHYLPKDQIAHVGLANDKNSFDELDEEAGLAYSGGSIDFYLEMLQMYLDGNMTEALQHYYEEKDWENYRIQMHALKSTSLSIGAIDMAELAEKLENGIKKGEIDTVVEEHGILLRGYQDLMNVIKKRLE